MNQSVPKSLRDAYNRARRIREIGRPDESHLVLKDFLAQKFTAAYCRAESEEELKRLQKLWQNIIVEVDDV